MHVDSSRVLDFSRVEASGELTMCLETTNTNRMHIFSHDINVQTYFKDNMIKVFIWNCQHF